MTAPAFRASRLRDAFPTGVAAVRQLIAHGIPERTAYHRCLDGGPWTRLLPGVVLLSTGQPTDDQLVHAALLLAGPEAVLTGVEACRRYGLRRGPSQPRDRRVETGAIHVLVPDKRQVRSVGFVHVERTKRIVVPLIRGTIPLAPIARACTDGARRLISTGEIAELFSEAVQRRFCTVAQLASDLEAGSRRGSAMPRAVLREVAEGVRSAAELDAKRIWRKTGLPEPIWNAKIYDANGRFLGIADCWVDEVAMAWETESGEWHMSPEDHDYTVERAGDFVAAGAVYIATKPKRMRTDELGVIEKLRATYAQAAARPRPPLRAEPAD
ncbi:hypothetical protein [Pseudonocardia sp. GCM10023141]|uniref:hypothetical protein n=1 Tax=Pseudonocardia sp. GCM10023141 TaxID=3252653 RepID=UPI00361DB389